MVFRGQRGEVQAAAWAVVLLAACLPAAAQEDYPSHPGVLPYQEWAEAGEIEQIPWRVRISDAELRYDQRQQVMVQVRLPLKALQRKDEQREFYFLVKAADGEGKWLPGERARRLVLGPRAGGARYGEIHAPVLMRPGDYQLRVFLYDPQAEQRSVALRRVKVAPPRRDPLPEMARGLPAVEFPARASGTEVAPPALAPLWLPVEATRPLQVEIIANFSPSQQYGGSVRAHRANLENVLQVLSVLTQLRPQHGEVNLTALDVLGMRRVWAEREIGELDWEELRAAALSINPLVVDRRSLVRNNRTGMYFLEQVQELMSRPAAEKPEPAPGGGNTMRPLRVLLVVGNPMLLPRGTPLPRLEEDGECDCRVYLLLPKVRQNNLWDDLGKVVAPLRPRRFLLDHPLHFRQALAEILRDLSR